MPRLRDRVLLYTFVAAFVLMASLAILFLGVAVRMEDVATESILRQIGAVQRLQEQRLECQRKDAVLRRIKAEFERIKRGR